MHYGREGQPLSLFFFEQIVNYYKNIAHFVNIC